ncbi:hypothetical protein [Streptomyces sp. NRRL S-474]|uniref:hypothetical protein n=1 Tax=Streptomyces sp. NRRL S-474 TaxID=1463909 RepID=UPI0004C5D4BD|nr:hypothetical protein [Streptomyces sp. NRRL S-474]
MRRLIMGVVAWVRLFRVPETRTTEQPMSLPVRRQVARPASPHPAPTVRAWYEPIDGSATRLVRPYLTASGVDFDRPDIHVRLGEAS